MSNAHDGDKSSLSKSALNRGKEFPPRQQPSSFCVDRMMEKMRSRRRAIE